jgi:hypothetical protein
VTVAVPLTLTVYSQTTERYKSDLVAREFAKSPTTVLLLILSFVNALVLVPLKFWSKSFFFKTLSPFMSQLGVLLFLIVLVLFGLKLIETLSLLNAGGLLSKLLKKSKLSLASGKISEAAFALEGAVDVILSELQRGKSASVERNLPFFTDSCVTLATLEESKWQSDAKKIENDKDEQLSFAVKLQFTPERLTPNLNTALNQLRKVFEGASIANMTDVAYLCLRAFRTLLRTLCSDAGNDASVEQVAQSISELINFAKKHGDPRIVNNLLDWYHSCVFENDSLKFLYQEKLEVFFRQQLETLIKEDRVDNFVNVIHSYLCSSFDYPHEEIFSLVDFDYRISSPEINILRDRVYKSRPSVNFESFRNTRTDLKALFELIRNQTDKQDFKRLEDAFEKANQSLDRAYKHQRLLAMFFRLGAYCVFKGKYALIPRIWSEHQPDDAEATWVGSDIVPRNLVMSDNLNCRLATVCGSSSDRIGTVR